MKELPSAFHYALLLAHALRRPKFIRTVELSLPSQLASLLPFSGWTLSDIGPPPGPLLTGARVVPCEPVHGGGAPLLLHPLRRLLVRLPVHPADRRRALQLHGLWWVQMTLTVKQIR